MQTIPLYVFVSAYCAGVIVLALVSSPVLQGLVFLVALGAAYFITKGTGSHTGMPVVLTVLAVLIATSRMAVVPTRAPETFSQSFDQKVVLEGTVITLPDIRETNQHILIEVQSGIQRTRILATVPLYPDVHVGDEVQVSGKLKQPAPFETDGGRTFAYDQFLRKDGVYGVMSAAQAKVTGQNENGWLQFLRVLELVKTTFMSLLQSALPEPESSLAAGIIVGGKQGLGVKLIDDFTRAGMLQIIVLSGYNVMIVANTLMRALYAIPKRISFGVAVASIVSFVLIAGAGSSALRAGLMAFFAIAARTFGKQYDVMRGVFASIFILGLWNPLMLVYDPGFQFSFIATLGLIIGVPVIAPRLLFLRSALLIELVSTTLAAEIALLPFLLWQTGNLSIVSVVANVIAMPAIPFAMGASTIAAALAFPLGHIATALPAIAGLPAYIPLTYVIHIATLCASLSFASVIIPSFPFWVVVLWYVALGVAVRLLRRCNDVPPLPS